MMTNTPSQAPALRWDSLRPERTAAPAHVLKRFTPPSSRATHARRIDVDTVRAQAAGRWLGVLERLAPELDRARERPGRHGPCPVHGGKDGFRLFRDAEETGGGICATCGAFADGFALLMWLKGWFFPEALEAVAGELGVTGHYARPPGNATVTAGTAPSAPDPALLAGRIERVWAQALPPLDPQAGPLQAYLDRRWLDPEMLDPGVVRFCPALAYWQDGRLLGTYPAMLAQVSAGDGSLVTLHRTYLSESGHKAPVSAPKKLMACPEGRRLCGGAIRLFAPGPILGLAEGIETALAVHLATGMPVWSTLSAALLERFEVPPGVRRVAIWADRDRSGTGQLAAEGLRERLLSQDLPAVTHLPLGPLPGTARGWDWADEWAARGAVRFPTERAGAAAA